MRPVQSALAGLVLAFFLGVAVPPPVAAVDRAVPAFALQSLPGQGGAQVLALARGPLVPPLRYRVLVIPGSGCAGMGAVAGRYFAGLLHAQVLVLHKPGVDPADRTAPGDCPSAFVQSDALAAWQGHAQAALATWLGRQDATLPTWLVGISEGAELLPGLAPLVPRLAGLVLVGASGLDPREAGRLQAQRLGQQAAWNALAHAQSGSAPDDDVVQGRSLRYWRDLWRWPLAQPLLDGAWPLLQVWGEADALVPPQAYQRFAERAQNRAASYCARRLPGADHGLQTGDLDGLQWVWAQLEQAARQARLGCTGAIAGPESAPAACPPCDAPWR